MWKKSPTSIKEWVQRFVSSSVGLPLTIGNNHICSHNFGRYFSVKTATDLFCWKNSRRESISKELYQLKWANCTVHGGMLAGSGLSVGDQPWVRLLLSAAAPWVCPPISTGCVLLPPCQHSFLCLPNCLNKGEGNYRQEPSALYETRKCFSMFIAMTPS